MGKVGGLARFWRIVRWPLLLALIGFAGIYLMVGLIGSVGYFGTTSLHSVMATENTWDEFKELFHSRKDGITPPVDVGSVRYDRRLIRSLVYLKRVTNTVCGWDGEHQKIQLDVKAEGLTDLFTPLYNLESTSTVYRGVGVRIDQADKVRCSYIDRCAENPMWLKWKEFDIPFQQSKTVCTNGGCPPKPPCWEIMCAVDYFPMDPVDVPPKDKTPLNDALMLKPLNPQVFNYDDIIEKGKKASVYKATQIAYQLMSIDRKNCENSRGNEGYKVNIPFQIIFPHWIQSKLGDTWSKLEEYHTDNFSLTALKKSPLAGVAFDLRLDEKGLHFNY